jgi:hypothetical protein
MPCAFSFVDRGARPGAILREGARVAVLIWLHRRHQLTGGALGFYQVSDELARDCIAKDIGSDPIGGRLRHRNFSWPADLDPGAQLAPINNQNAARPPIDPEPEFEPDPEPEFEPDPPPWPEQPAPPPEQPAGTPARRRGRPRKGT